VDCSRKAEILPVQQSHYIAPSYRLARQLFHIMFLIWNSGKSKFARRSCYGSAKNLERPSSGFLPAGNYVSRCNPPPVVRHRACRTCPPAAFIRLGMHSLPWFASPGFCQRSWTALRVSPTRRSDNQVAAGSQRRMMESRASNELRTLPGRTEVRPVSPRREVLYMTHVCDTRRTAEIPARPFVGDSTPIRPVKIRENHLKWQRKSPELNRPLR